MFVVLCKEDGEEVKEKDFEDALEGVCEKLASGIVRNGEGTGHVIKVEVMNYPGPDSEEPWAAQARAVASAAVPWPR